MRVSTENIWAGSPRGTGKEKKPASLTNCKCTDSIESTMEFTMENAQEIQQNFYKPNIELSKLGGEGGRGGGSESCL